MAAVVRVRGYSLWAVVLLVATIEVVGVDAAVGGVVGAGVVAELEAEANQ